MSTKPIQVDPATFKNASLKNFTIMLENCQGDARNQTGKRTSSRKSEEQKMKRARLSNELNQQDQKTGAGKDDCTEVQPEIAQIEIDNGEEGIDEERVEDIVNELPNTPNEKNTGTPINMYTHTQLYKLCKTMVGQFCGTC